MCVCVAQVKEEKMVRCLLLTGWEIEVGMTSTGRTALVKYAFSIFIGRPSFVCVDLLKFVK